MKRDRDYQATKSSPHHQTCWNLCAWSFMGLLLWPVATCDLATLLEDVDWLQNSNLDVVTPQLDPESVEQLAEQASERHARLLALGIPDGSVTAMRDNAVSYLEKTIGCTASAVAYLHRSGIKHKDLKPSNILLSEDALWLTDFGTATDFSILTSSATESGEWGTPKYFAPETAVFKPSGRSADIFSLGCIFFEIITLCVGYTLELTKSLRKENDMSFQSNLSGIEDWFMFG